MKLLANRKLQKSGFILTRTSPQSSDLHIWHKNKGQSTLRFQYGAEFLDSFGNTVTPLKFKKWGAWTNDRFADTLPLDYDVETFINDK